MGTMVPTPCDASSPEHSRASCVRNDCSFKRMLPRAVTKLVTRGEERQLETARDAELVENPREVMLDGVFSDRKPLCDRAVRPARNHHGDDAELGPGQAE